MAKKLKKRGLYTAKNLAFVNAEAMVTNTMINIIYPSSTQPKCCKYEGKRNRPS